jgi:hypothetical protein
MIALLMFQSFLYFQENLGFLIFMKMSLDFKKHISIFIASKENQQCMLDTASGPPF